MGADPDVLPADDPRGAAGGCCRQAVCFYLTNRLRLGFSGLYPVLTLGVLFLAYSVTALIGGSGFLAVYLVGLMMSREEFLHKRSLLRFTTAWPG